MAKAQLCRSGARQSYSTVLGLSSSRSHRHWFHGPSIERGCGGKSSKASQGKTTPKITHKRRNRNNNAGCRIALFDSQPSILYDVLDCIKRSNDEDETCIIATAFNRNVSGDSKRCTITFATSRPPICGKTGVAKSRYNTTTTRLTGSTTAYYSLSVSHVGSISNIQQGSRVGRPLTLPG
jgi:hypothetical protein